MCTRGFEQLAVVADGMVRDLKPYRISDRLLRMSVGLEDVDDLWTDLSKALAIIDG